MTKDAAPSPIRKKQHIVRLREFALALATLGAGILVSARLEFFELLDSYAHLHEGWQLDEIVMVLMFSSLVSLILLLRRAGDLRREIARREASEQEATKLARHDPLTGLANRRVLNEELDAQLEAVKTGATECAAYLIDLDLFKPVNDAHGHLGGDTVLVVVARRLTETVAEFGTVARMGGDEFACVIAYPTDSDLPARLAARIVRRIAEPISIAGLEIQISCSVGIARAPQDGTTASALLYGADLAMHEAKGEGGGACRFYHVEMDVELRERVALEADLRAVVARGEIVPYFQPIVELGRGRIVGFEALARWPHPDLGQVAPDRFIPVAEDIGIIGDLTDAMLRTACAAARDWPADLTLSINVSPLQLRDPWLAPRLLGILTESGFAPSRLILEVTENAVIEDMVHAADVFVSLRNAGVRTALDDFGKGCSSLYHLLKLNFDHLKIDRSFVHSMDTADSVKIVSAVASLGKSLGMSVTAEGVETAAEADALRALGCDHAQGYLFGQPLDAEGTLALLNGSAHRAGAMSRSA